MNQNKQHVTSLATGSAAVFATGLIFAWGVLRNPQNAFDDAFITYRYAKNFGAGLGLVYTPGEWVLGTTAPLYAMLLGVLPPVVGSVAWWGHWLSVIGWIGSAWMAFAIFCEQKRRIAGCLAALFIALNPLVVPALGMETAVLIACVLAAIWAWMRHRWDWSILFSAAAILIRQDAALIIGLLGLASWQRHKTLPWRETLGVLILTLPWFAYAQWRYGSVLPNSALAKIGQNNLMAVGGAKSFFATYVSYLTGDSVITSLAFAVAIIGGVWVIARHLKGWWWLPVWGTAYIGIYTLLRVAPFPWYFIPPITMAFMLAALGLGSWLGDDPWPSHSDRPSIMSISFPVLATIASVICCVGILGGQWSRTYAQAVSPAPGHLPEYKDVGQWLATHSPARARVATIEIGVIGYTSNRPLLDTMGLVSPEMNKHLLGWGESLAYAITQLKPDYAIALTQTAWEGIVVQPWFTDTYEKKATFNRATIYQRRPDTLYAYRTVEKAEFANGISLSKVETTHQNLDSLMHLNIKLDFDVSESITSDCQLVVYLTNHQTGARFSQISEQPFGGTYSCRVWQRGDHLEVPVLLTIDKTMPPGTYRIGVEIFDIQQGERVALKAIAAVSEAQMGWLRLGKPGQANTELPRAPVAAWAGGLTLVRRHIALTPVLPGQPVSITFAWRISQPQPRDLTFFVHVLNQSGQIVAQLDRPPFGGQFATTVWLPQETPEDTYTIELPSALAAGNYFLRFGFYDSLGRLSLADGSVDYVTESVSAFQIQAPD